MYIVPFDYMYWGVQKYRRFGDMSVSACCNVSPLLIVLMQDWMKTLMDSDSYFDSEAKFGMAKSTGKPETSRKEDALDCLAGSYRKLDI